MASTRQSPSVQIFQDPGRSFETVPPTNKPLPRLQPSAIPLQPVKNPSSNRNIILNPPATGSSRSPQKPRRSTTPSKATKNTLNFVSIPPPRNPTFYTDSPPKKHIFPTFQAVTAPMSQQPLFTTFHSAPSESVEEHAQQPITTYNDNFADFPDPSYGVKAPLKRTLLEAAPLKDRSAKKLKREETAILNYVPEPEDMPTVDDDGTKPPYSYATLIGMAILRGPNRRLTLAQIYKWISDTFTFYQRGDAGWQNSIRHNLSLNKAFIKQERPKNDPGKGNYWAIEPGMEMQFIKDKPIRRSTMTSITLPAATTRKDMPQQLSDAASTSWVIPQAPAPEVQPAAETFEPSSDATLPASDPAFQDDDADDSILVQPYLSQAPHSSPLQHINSSPPLVRHGTPPPAHRIAPSSGPRARKRKLAAMNDSGYFSSLESSAMRSSRAGNLLPSEGDPDQPRIKRGRAEEEIARIRSSSHDISPRNPRFFEQPLPPLLTSSPIKEEIWLMLPPLTPAMKLKKPAKPPPSVSPNTNLRNHRRKVQELVNSPIKQGLTGEDLSWSPAFKIHEEGSASHDNFHVHFDIFADPTTPAASGSPEKRSASRPQLGRASTSGDILADITGLSNNSKGSIPSLKTPKLLKGMATSKSPSKSREFNTNFLDFPQEDLFGFELFADENSDDGSGVDILQGFQKIGGVAASKEEKSAKKALGSRPPLGQRSQTSRF